MRLVLDTSALVRIVERRIDVGQLLEHELYVPAAVLGELRLLAARQKKAQAVLDVLQLLRPKTYEKGGPADKAVLESSKELGAALVTGDAALAEKARRLGIPVAKFHKGQLAIY